jgi:hypothetical protein
MAKADLTVIGVAQPHFHGEQIGAAPDLWIPLDMQPQIDAGPHVARGRSRPHRGKGDVAARHRPPQAGRFAQAGAGQRGRRLQAGGGRGILELSRSQPDIF